LPVSRSGIGCGGLRFVFELLPAADDRHRAGRRWCVVRGSEVLIASETGDPLLDEELAAAAADAGTDHPTEAGAVFLGVLDERPVWALAASTEAAAPPGHEFVHLRRLPARHEELAWMLGARAVQLVDWARTHRYCGACGAPTAPSDRERAMVCPDCGLTAFPRLSPAVIMVVHRGPELLLAHGRSYPQPFYGPLAGFVEVGETLEHAVRREVREEVGVEVGEVTYVTSQPWPFPNSLMIGFFAEYAGGDIRIDPEEIVDARWFGVDDIPRSLDSFVISARLVEAHLARVRGGEVR
jgi:NAD+ diphosphatase